MDALALPERLEVHHVAKGLVSEASHLWRSAYRGRYMKVPKAMQWDPILMNNSVALSNPRRVPGLRRQWPLLDQDLQLNLDSKSSISESYLPGTKTATFFRSGIYGPLTKANLKNLASPESIPQVLRQY